MKKRVIVLGSAGSVGLSSLDVLGALADDWDVVGLATGSRGKVLAEQAHRFCPEAVAIADPQAAEALGDALRAGGAPGRSAPPRVIAGPDAAVRLLDEVECDCVILAITGAASLPATLRAVELGLRVALANKEALVLAGSILIPLAKKTGATILPVDSEHSAIFQAMQAGRPSEVRRVYLTASGGPFLDWTKEQMATITLEAALNHPTWEMGPKVTIDSATMMNKALEIVEARWLFDLEPDQIEVVVHPEAIIHSMVEFCDGSIMAQMGTPDMRTPIQYALTYPERKPCPAAPLDLFAVGTLTLRRPDEDRFPAIRLGKEVARRGGTAGAVLNAANEQAVALFRNSLIEYADIARLTETVMNEHTFCADPTLDDLLRADQWARDELTRCTTPV